VKRFYCTPRCLLTQESDTGPYKLLACSLKGGPTNYFHTLWRRTKPKKQKKWKKQNKKNKKSWKKQKTTKNTICPYSLERGGTIQESVNMFF
jgi:hypothetical protein